MLNPLISLLILLFLIACKRGPTLIITSNTPARIEKNGIQACGQTPCATGGFYYQDPIMPDVCLGGANTRLEAFPLDHNSGFKQSKIVYASCDQTIDVFFDMSSGGIVNTVTHNSKSNTSTTTSIIEKLNLLKNLKTKNLISNEEYQIKRKEILDSIK